MWPLLDTISESDIPMKDKLTYLTLVTHVHNLQLESETDINFVKDRIEELFSSSITRFEGLLYMDAVLSRHPAVYIKSWGRIIVPSLQCPETYVSRELTLRILNQVIKNFSNDTTCSESFQRFIPDIVPLLMTVENDDKAFHFYCQTLTVCMRKLPNLIGPHKTEIEQFLMKNMDAFSTKTAVALAECFSALPLVSLHSQRSRGKTFRMVWIEIYLKTLNTLQALLNDIIDFSPVLQGPHFVPIATGDVFQIPFHHDEKELSFVLARVRVFSSLSRCLAQMLSSEGCRITVPVQELLHVLGRIFVLKEKAQLTDRGIKFETYALCYPILQSAAYVIVEALIMNFTIVEQSGNVTSLMQQSIEISNMALFSSSMKQVRSSTWKILNIWLKQYGAKASFDIINNKFLMKELLKEVDCDTPESNNTSQVDESVTDPDEYRVESCLDALKALKNIFITSGSYLDTELEQAICSAVLKAVQTVQLHQNPAMAFPFPYTNQTCRKKLYDLLLASCLHGEPLRVKYNMQAVNIFRIALKDPSLEVTRICHKAFKLCRYCINPKKPPPESVLYSRVESEVPAPPPPTEENIRTAWDDGNWTLNGSSQNEGVMDMSAPCQIENVYQSVEDDGQRDLLPVVQPLPSPNHYPEPQLDGECNNGDSNRLVSNNPRSHSDLGDESESDDDRIYCEEDNLHPIPSAVAVDIPEMATPKISLNNSEEPQSPISEPNMTELRPLKPVIQDSEKIENLQNFNDTEVAMNTEEGELDEETLSDHSPKRMTENGMDESEEESGEEEDESEEEDEEVSECHSSEYSMEHVIKRQKMNNEEEHSEEEYEEERSFQNQENENQMGESDEEENDVPNKSPTIREMCRDFVFAEPDEIS